MKPKLRFKEFSDEWQVMKLSNISSGITKGTTPKKYSDSGINFIKVENIHDNIITNINSYISENTHYGELKRSILKENDILFSIAGALGRTAIVKKDILPANTNQACSIIRLDNPDEIDLNYLINRLNNTDIKNYIFKCQSVGAQPNLSLEQVNNVLISYPSKNEQRKIGKLLSTIDKKIELQTKKIEDLKLFNEKIIRNLISNQNDTNYSFSELFYFKYGDGNTNPSNNGDYPVYGANGIIGGYDKYNAENCSIIGHMGAYAGTVLWENKKCFVTYNGTIAKSKNENILDNKFGYYILLSKNLPKICAGSGMPFLSYDKLNTINAFVPSIIEQKNILKKLDLIDEKLNLEQKKLRNLLLLKKGLMQNMFV